MKEVSVFTEQQILEKAFKIYGDLETPLFLAKDVASWIEHSKTSVMLDGIEESEKLRETIFTSGQKREMWFLTEDGLYEVLMQSRKPIAKAFKKQVKVILKDIRKHGMYATEDLLNNPDFLIQVAMELKKEKEQNKILSLEVAKTTQMLGELQPKIDYVTNILNNKGLVTITQIGKDYGMSGQALNLMLNEKKVQFKQSGQWLLFAKYHDKGYTHSKTINITHSDGRPDVRMETKWTQKGRLFIYDLLKADGVLPIIEQNQAS